MFLLKKKITQMAGCGGAFFLNLAYGMQSQADYCQFCTGMVLELSPACSLLGKVHLAI